MADLEANGLLALNEQGLSSLDERMCSMSPIPDDERHGTDAEHNEISKRAPEAPVA